MNVCVAPECERPSYSRNLCRPHYEAEPDIVERKRVYERERYQRRKGDPAYHAGVKERKARYYRTPKGKAQAADEHRRWRDKAGTERTRDYNRFYLYGVTRDQWDAMFAAQDGRCAICRCAEPTGRWCIDHDHACCPGMRACGKCIRGILCNSCNSGLGHFADDPERLRAAIAYLGG